VGGEEGVYPPGHDACRRPCGIHPHPLWDPPSTRGSPRIWDGGAATEADRRASAIKPPDARTGEVDLRRPSGNLPFPFGEELGGIQLSSSSSSSESDGRLKQIPSGKSASTCDGPAPEVGEKGGASGLRSRRGSAADPSSERPVPEGGGGGERPIHCWGADSRGVAHAVAERAAGVPVEVAAGAGWSPAGSVSLARERS